MTPMLPPSLFRRDDIFRTHAAGVSACGIVVKPDARHAYRQRVMESAVVVYVIRGSGWFEDWNGGRERVEDGCFIEMPAGRRHGVVHDGDGQWCEAYVTYDRGLARLLA